MSMSHLTDDEVLFYYNDAVKDLIRCELSKCGTWEHQMCIEAVASYRSEIRNRNIFEGYAQ